MLVKLSPSSKKKYCAFPSYSDHSDFEVSKSTADEIHVKIIYPDQGLFIGSMTLTCKFMVERLMSNKKKNTWS